MPKTPPRAWILQPSKRRLDLLAPTPFDWEDRDLAEGLARTARWGGRSIWPRPFSVAQHSLLVMHLHRQMRGGSLPVLVALQDLLHDAEEGLLNYDPLSPVKPFLGEAFLQLMDRLRQVVFIRYGVPLWTPEEKVEHKKADNLSAACEAVHVVGWTPAEVRGILGIRMRPLDRDPLVLEYGGTQWEPWPPEVAEARYLEALERLLKHRDLIAS